MVTLAGSDGQNIDPLGGFSDANLANKNDEQVRSISGYCFYLFGMLVSWRSKLQTLTAASTFESELIALSFAANEAVWIRKLLHELHFTLGDNVNLRHADESKHLHSEIDPDSVIDFDRHRDEDIATTTPHLAQLAERWRNGRQRSAFRSSTITGYLIMHVVSLQSARPSAPRASTPSPIPCTARRGPPRAEPSRP